MSPKRKPMTFLEAAKAVLEEMKQPMHFKKITEVALQKRYLQSEGKTPEWTMGARLSVDVKEKGSRSEFMRTDNGKYGLRKWRRSSSVGAASALADSRSGSSGRQFWLIAVEPENFDADFERNSFDTVGVKHRMRRTLARINPDDRIVIYIKKRAEFAAILKVTGESYIDERERWPAGGDDLSARIDTEPSVVLSPGKRVDARPLYARLAVFTRYPEKHRTLALRNGITEINEGDFERIRSSLKKSAR